MASMPLVSAIIPAYNGVSRYLEQSIRSVLAQTYQNCELIVVDDASTDNTAQLVLRFPQVRYLRQADNRGQSATRNEGARLAQGIFLAFLDQDDLWEPSFLEETVPMLQAAPEAALVHCDGYQINERNEILEYDGAMKQTTSITQILRGGHDVATSGSLFRKACFDDVGGYDEQLPVWEDIDLAIRLYQRFRLLHLPKPLYRHRLYARNASRDIPSERALLGRHRFLEKHASACHPGSAAAAALKQDWAHYHGDLGKHHFEAGRVEEARRAFRHALRYHPFNWKTLMRLLRSYLLRGGLRPTPSPHR
jgi:glycosyltransferase involved in cell wall biosynthesis